jgi:hypothetical protein
LRNIAASHLYARGATNPSVNEKAFGLNALSFIILCGSRLGVPNKLFKRSRKFASRAIR